MNGINLYKEEFIAQFSQEAQKLIAICRRAEKGVLRHGT